MTSKEFSKPAAFRRIQKLFTRTREIWAKVTSAPNRMESHLAEAEFQKVVAEYESRGHGEGLAHNKHSRHTVAQDKRAATKKRNRARNKRRN